MIQIRGDLQVYSVKNIGFRIFVLYTDALFWCFRNTELYPSLFMRNTILGLLVTILILTVVNLLSSFGVIGSSSESTTASKSGAYEYKVLNAAMMDNIGFRAVAKDEGIPVGEKGEINFPKKMVEKIAKVNLLPRTIQEVEKDGGWKFVAATNDNHYIFRRVK